MDERGLKTALYEQVARIGKALASPKRLELLEALAQSEQTVDALAQQLGMDIRLTSAHLKALREAQLVEGRREGKFVVYRLTGADVAVLGVQLRAVAEAIGMHESTVSRVTSNKYLSCPRGLYELKYFFTSGVAAADGDGAVSAEAVKSHIKALIGAEEAHAILSDDTLVDLLRAKGMDIARRTVAKYRESMGIGSSVQRRRQKALKGKAA